MNKTMVAKRRTALRRYPDLMAGLAGYAESGEKIDVLSRMNGWYQVSRKLEIAYASADTLRDQLCELTTMLVGKSVLYEGKNVRGKDFSYFAEESCIDSAERKFDNALFQFQKSCNSDEGRLENVPDKHEILFSRQVRGGWQCSFNVDYHLKGTEKEPVYPRCVDYHYELGEVCK